MLPLRSSWFSPWLLFCHQNSGFPLKPDCRVTFCRTGLPLSRHFNPCPAPKDSLEVFPDSFILFLASFAVTVSSGQQIIPGSRVLSPSTIPATTQSRLHCLGSLRRQVHQLIISINQPPRDRGLRPHAIVDRPSPLTPSNDPRLGVNSHHQGLHLYAGNGFLGPSSEQLS